MMETLGSAGIPEAFLLTTTPNGIKSIEQASRPTSGHGSREENILAKGAHQLNIVSTPSDDEDEGVGSEEYEADFESEDEPTKTLSIRPAGLSYSSLPTGVCYDSRMRFHTELDPSKDRAEYHPEDPRRIYYIFKTICEAGLIYSKELSVGPTVEQPLLLLPARQATKAEVMLVHDEGHYDLVRGTASKSIINAPYPCLIFPDSGLPHSVSHPKIWDDF